MGHIAVDIETLGIRTNSVILSLGIVTADFNEDFDVNRLYENSFFVKFDIKDQVKNLGRTIDERTKEWWSKQDIEVQNEQLMPLNSDVPIKQGLLQAHDWLTNLSDHLYNKKNSWIWIRGDLDRNLLENAANQVNIEPLFPFYKVRDTRTAIDLLTDSTNGYCEIDHEMPELKKHGPVEDCIIDLMMLKYGK